ncbi:phosphonate ABC transporter ATP-binding protein [Clostridium sp. CX1]|uniref:phosphonate ABC transporter ATP-binding protein n=1 Tax=Clostridium sp. CX1 TaxID=2978346 RepID=UPI0021C0ECBD|nr:phosphonate ABC transporter ATP-binding protein [Clostridium sp. CX1]MCT8976556.1 phosphonate ABC transporter ATP-binding protein [Clostridium sp. CX1]
MKNIFELQDVSKIYGNKTALAPLSITIKKGEIVALIGPSGAGKTTLLNALANIIKPDSGKLLIDGIPAAEYKTGKQLAKKVGIIRQQFDLVGQLPVIQNVLAGRLSEWGFFKSFLSLLFPQEKELAAKALKRVGLLEKIYEKTSTLSGGEQQRVALARLLVQKPEVILADEPVASLDPARSEDVLSMLTELVREENQTLVASMHSVEYAKRYFTRVIALRQGKVYFDLPTEKVTERDLAMLYDLKELRKDA